MAEFAIIGPDGVVENIAVAKIMRDVAVPSGRTIRPVRANAEIGGVFDGAKFIRMPRPPEEPAIEPAAHRAIRALADEISPRAKAAIEAIIGATP